MYVIVAANACGILLEYYTNNYRLGRCVDHFSNSYVRVAK